VGILTIGHSTHGLDHFLRLVTEHRVTAIADVRSVPASRFTPQFNRDALKHALREVQVNYVFLGKELGARSDDPTCYVNGRVQYQRLAQTPAFVEGIERLRTGMQTERVALVCAEQEPLDCHRAVLVSRVFDDLGVSVAASTFFGLLGRSGARRLVDVRLNNVSQLAGFAKRRLDVLPRRTARYRLCP
jgi:uncharacterized protein (DUF488 family)